MKTPSGAGGPPLSRRRPAPPGLCPSGAKVSTPCSAPDPSCDTDNENLSRGGAPQLNVPSQSPTIGGPGAGAAYEGAANSP